MKSDGFKGGTMVFNGEEDNTNGEGNGGKRLSLKKGQTVGGGKRKKNENFVGFEKKNPTIQFARESVDGIKKTPIRVSNGRSSMELCKDLSLFVDNDINKTPFQIKKGAAKCVDMKKQRSGVLTRTGKTNGNGNEGNSVQLRRPKSEGNEDLGLDSIEENENNPFETDKNNEGLAVCQEKIISSCANNGDTVKSSPESLLLDDGDGVEDDEEFYEDQIEEEEEFEAGNENKSFDIKEMNVQDDKLAKIAINEVKSPEEKGSKFVNGVKKLSQFHNKTTTFSSTVNKQPPPVVKIATSVYTTPTKSKPFDLVMWRDISKSALIFGIGTFITISSSYTQDLNISFISVISYVGLVYLAAMFLHRSIICRGVMEIDESSCVVGEEAIWLLELFLPYLNEFLSKLKALFSGDPATTMKLALLLFVLARCGSSIAIWKMAKLGFFGVSIVPKLCSYSVTPSEMIAIIVVNKDYLFHCHFLVCLLGMVGWLKAFMLFVALRYYQHGGGVEADGDVPASEEAWEGPTGNQIKRARVLFQCPTRSSDRALPLQGNLQDCYRLERQHLELFKTVLSREYNTWLLRVSTDHAIGRYLNNYELGQNVLVCQCSC
ncbi:Reticulon family protein, putative isoform 2 [Hibiscus syriacus]|uniref:Reticulon-like protein n=1 Tax=Hibiscus syriacus TaxID=106335 RepID=A0A6A2YKG1_HIBSY|nr:Reticulon family protein, putative isoform 2 [Hibiscus syriacus]